MAHNAKNMVALLIRGGENFLLSSKKMRMITKKTKKSAIPAIINRIPLMLLLIMGVPRKSYIVQ